jgi:hypothetical protein
MDPSVLDVLNAMSLERKKWTTSSLVLKQNGLPPIDIASCYMAKPSIPKAATGEGAVLYNQPESYPNNSYFRLSFIGLEAMDDVIAAYQSMAKASGFSVYPSKKLKLKFPTIYFVCTQSEVPREKAASTLGRNFSGPNMTQDGAKHETVKMVKKKSLDAVDRMQSKKDMKELKAKKGGGFGSLSRCLTWALSWFVCSELCC